MELDRNRFCRVTIGEGQGRGPVKQPGKMGRRPVLVTGRLDKPGCATIVYLRVKPTVHSHPGSLIVPNRPRGGAWVARQVRPDEE